MRDVPTFRIGQASRSGLRSLVIVLLNTFLALTVAAQRRERLVDTWKPMHYNVNIFLSNQLTTIDSATTKVRAAVVKQNVNMIDLDFGELTIDSVNVDAVPARFERKPDRLNVQLNRPANKGDVIEITIKYHGIPKDGLILTNDRDGKPSATGDNWPDRVHHWIPCLDHPSAKATVTFTVTAPVRDLVVANGAFEGSHGNFGGTTTWSFNESRPIPPYCMVIVVTEGAKLDAPGLLTPLSYYVPRTDRDYAMKGFSPAAPAVAFFSQLIAPYPYEKLALIVGATRFGGMENSSAIVFGSNIFEPGKAQDSMSARFGIPERIEDVVAHEIAHQWFGDSVTESTWSDLWLSEGFATYFAGLFIQRHDGEQAFQDYMRQAAKRYFAYEQAKRTPIFDRDTEDLFKLLNPNNYQKGAWVLHMLRSRLGDDAFFRGLRGYYNSHRDATATTEDLRAALEKSSGLNLREFFARWIYGTGHPRYELSWTWSNETKMLNLVLRQLQPEPAFQNFLPVEISSSSGSQQIVLKPVGKDTRQKLRMNGPPTAINIDPANQVLKEAAVIKGS
ncbi:MAG TPA: M1 family metallopeptidase [Pyrinomonadaceae bacterium]|jgi:aminopeptidase N